MSQASTVLFWGCAAGVVAFSTLGLCFGRKYPFFKFHGDFEEAAKSCWKAAFLLLIGASVCVFPAITKVVDDKRRQLRNLKKHVLPGGYRR